MNVLIRKGSFDACHRVMNECMKCFNVHGHTYLYELHFQYKSEEEIGYAIDFKEIKRIACQWIDDFLDHAAILNPEDHLLIKTCEDLKSKIWIMNLNGHGNYCNPSAENIAKELFLAMKALMNTDNLWIQKIVLYETPNCFVECNEVGKVQESLWNELNWAPMSEWRDAKGIQEYDDRKIKAPTISSK